MIFRKFVSRLNTYGLRGNTEKSANIIGRCRIVMAQRKCVSIRKNETDRQTNSFLAGCTNISEIKAALKKGIKGSNLQDIITKVSNKKQKSNDIASYATDIEALAFELEYAQGFGRKITTEIVVRKCTFGKS